MWWRLIQVALSQIRQFVTGSAALPNVRRKQRIEFRPNVQSEPSHQPFRMVRRHFCEVVLDDFDTGLSIGSSHVGPQRHGEMFLVVIQGRASLRSAHKVVRRRIENG